GIVISNGDLVVSDSGLFVTGSISVPGTPTYGLDVVGDGTITGHLNYGNAVFSSDFRLKKDIKMIENALAKVSQLTGVYYSWIQDHELGLNFDSRRHIGVIAQDVKQIVPEVVGEIHDGKHLGVKYSSLTPVLVESVKEMNSMIDELDSIADLIAQELTDLGFLD
ncbi:unnamed protein product, partial [Ectocarpus fasciculatus]